MDLLECTVMPYAWGSRSAIAQLTGRSAPTTEPEAELWMGAHPMAPSRVTRAGASGAASLAEIIATDPVRELGASVANEFGPRLPFLLKVLAAAQPLSIQAHPNMDQARAGFDDEEKKGIPRDAGHRNYKDASHKPELLCALTPFDALCGFRSIDKTIQLFDRLAVRALDDKLAPLRATRDREGLAETFRAIMSTPEIERMPLVDAVVEACEESGVAFAHERAWAVRLAALYPGDVGVVSALLLNLVHLEPGDAIYLGAGNLHAYLEGTGVEIMASSDNVLRGGLTKKHVDVPELMKVLDFVAGPVAPLRPAQIDDVERVYETPAREFRLSVLDLRSRAGGVTRELFGPEILLVTGGSASLGGRKIEKGQAVFVPACLGTYTLEGDAIVYRATVGAR
jgi:mannose-6-phosphate isomerase